MSGDGAVGLCGVIAAKRLGAEQIVIMGHHEDRLQLARELGATVVVTERGVEAVARIRELTGGVGAHAGARDPRRNHRPRRMFDRIVDLDGVPDGYQAMAERRAIKVMVKP